MFGLFKKKGALPPPPAPPMTGRIVSAPIPPSPPNVGSSSNQSVFTPTSSSSVPAPLNIPRVPSPQGSSVFPPPGPVPQGSQESQGSKWQEGSLNVMGANQFSASDENQLKNRDAMLNEPPSFDIPSVGIEQELPPLPENLDFSDSSFDSKEELNPPRSVSEVSPSAQSVSQSMQSAYASSVPRPRSLPPVTSGDTVFVSSSDYQDIQSTVQAVKTILSESEVIMVRLQDLKNQQDKSLDEWRVHLADIEKKLSYVDQAVFKEGVSHV